MKPKKEIEDKKKALTWVLNFIHSDLEKLSEEEWEDTKNHLFSLYVGPFGFRNKLQEFKFTRGIFNIYETLKDHLKAQGIMSEGSFTTDKTETMKLSVSVVTSQVVSIIQSVYNSRALASIRQGDKL